MKRLSILAMVLAVGTASAKQMVDIEKGKQIAQNVCAACHAADGNSAIATYPKIAAQHAAYVVAQTKAIKEGKRTTGAASAMAAMVQNLSDQDMKNVAAYFAKQYAKPGESNPKQDMALGRKIFLGGLAEKKVPACMSCHGPNGAGIPGGGTDITAYPRLGGQHGTYVVEQLKAYAGGQRKSANGMMETIAQRLSEEEMKAVGNFVQGLR